VAEVVVEAEGIDENKMKTKKKLVFEASHPCFFYLALSPEELTLG